MVCMIYIIWFVVCVYFDCMGGWVYLFGVNIYIWCEYSSFILCVYSFIVWVYEYFVYIYLMCVSWLVVILFGVYICIY